MMFEYAARTFARNPLAKDDVEKVTVRLPFVGGVEERDVGGEILPTQEPKRRESVLIQKTVSGGYSTDYQILADQAPCFRTRFNENHLPRASAECINADSAGACKSIEDHGSLDARAKNIE